MAAGDLYTALGLEPTATQHDIRDAYCTLAKRYHPDKNKEDSASHRFQSIAKAYQTLFDPETRAAYDNAQGWAGGHDDDQRDHQVAFKENSNCVTVQLQPEHHLPGFNVCLDYYKTQPVDRGDNGV